MTASETPTPRPEHRGHGEGLNMFIGRVSGCPACEASAAAERDEVCSRSIDQFLYGPHEGDIDIDAAAEGREDPEPRPAPCGCGLPLWSEDAEEEEPERTEWCSHWCIEDVMPADLRRGDLVACPGDIPLEMHWTVVESDPEPGTHAHMSRPVHGTTAIHSTPFPDRGPYQVLRLGMVGRQTIEPPAGGASAVPPPDATPNPFRWNPDIERRAAHTWDEGYAAALADVGRGASAVPVDRPGRAWEMQPRRSGGPS